MPSDLTTLYVRLPSELHEAVKVEAAKRRRSMRFVIIEALEAWLLEIDRKAVGWKAEDARD